MYKIGNMTVLDGSNLHKIIEKKDKDFRKKQNEESVKMIAEYEKSEQRPKLWL